MYRSVIITQSSLSFGRVPVVPGKKCLVGISWWCSEPGGGSRPHLSLRSMRWSSPVTLVKWGLTRSPWPYPLGLYASSKGSITRSSKPRVENPQGGGGCLLGTRARSSGDTAYSSFDMGGWSGAVVPVVSSAPGIGEGTLFKGVVATGSFPNPSYISFSMLNKLLFSTMGSRQLWSSCTAPQSTSWEALNSTPLEHK